MNGESGRMRTSIEPDLLQTFVAISDTGSFTDAGRRVHRTQSAVSMQVKRLEDLLGRSLFLRDGRTVRLTRDGEVLLGHARRILKVHQEALSAFDGGGLQGRVTLGSRDEDAVTVLPTILSRFAETHCCVHVEVVCDRTRVLLAKLSANEIDLAVVSDGYGAVGGTLLAREPVVWVVGDRFCVHERDPVPLAVYHAGCHVRKWAIEALARQGRAYSLAYSSVSLSAIHAAVRAGLAVGALPRSTVLEGFRILGEADGFPPMPGYESILVRAPNAQTPLHDTLACHIIESFGAAATAPAPFAAAPPRLAGAAG